MTSGQAEHDLHDFVQVNLVVVNNIYMPKMGAGVPANVDFQYSAKVLVVARTNPEKSRKPRQKNIINFNRSQSTLYAWLPENESKSKNIFNSTGWHAHHKFHTLSEKQV